MIYNTQRRPLLLSEYGRNVQELIEFCLSLEDREARNLCARGIIGVMRRLTPREANTPEKEQKLWDHLNIMSGFRLDIDFPFPVVTEDEAHPKPTPIPYSDNKIRWRHYGRNIEKMVSRVAELEDGDDKDALISMLAHQMKKLQLIHNPEGVDDAKILRDLALYSKGKIDLDPATYLLHEFKEAPVPEKGRKGGRKKKKSMY